MGSKFYGSGSKWFGGGGNVPSVSWIIANAVADFDFVNQRYYFNGSVKSPDVFASFSGATFSGGLVLDGTASHDIRIPWADIGISEPFSMHASWTPAAVGVGQITLSADINTSNMATLGVSGTNGAQYAVTTANTLVANMTVAAAASVGVRLTVGGQFETNNGLHSVNGATGAAADTSVSTFTPSTLRFGERASGTVGLNGTLLRVTLFSGTKDQTALNAENTLVHAI